MKVPFFSPTLVNAEHSQALQDAFSRVLHSNQLILGAEVQAFEEAFARYIGTKYCVGVSNGLDALVLSLKACGIGPGDEVIVPAHTYTATWMAVVLAGATPVGADCMSPRYDLDEGTIGAVVTAKTKAIIPVHLYGEPQPKAVITELAQYFNLTVIEDNAQAIGATITGQKTGSFGIANAHSFYPTKTLGALGDAGAITTNDEELYQTLKMLRSYGAPRKNQHDIIGHNCRLDELQAAFLNIKLKGLDTDNTERKRLAAIYNKLLADIDTLGFYCPTHHVYEDYSSVYHLYVIRSPHRDALAHYLAEQGVETQIHYPTPPHLQKAFAYLGYKMGDFPIAEQYADTVLSLPLYPGMPDEWVVYTANCIRQYYGLAKV